MKIRTERGAIIAASLVVYQTPLGYNNNTPAELRNEISRSNGSVAMHRQIILNVSVEHWDALYVKDIHDNAVIMECRNDRRQCVIAPHQCKTSCTCWRNIHISGEFHANENDPSTRFENITHGYESLNAVEQAITESLTHVEEGPQHHLREIMDNFAAANRYLKNANNDRARACF